MRLSYKLNNVYGSVYTGGTLQFMADGYRLLSPISNKIAIYDLKNAKSETLDIEFEYNLRNVSLNTNSSLLLASTEKTQMYVISLISEIIVNRKHFKHIGEKINDLQFSPNGKYYAICGPNQVMVYRTPSQRTHMSFFKTCKIIKRNDEMCCLSWSINDQLLIIASKDNVMRIYAIESSNDNIPDTVNLMAHNDTIIACFFANNTQNELNIYSLSADKQLVIWEANYSSFEQLNQLNKQNMRLNYRKEKKYYLNDDIRDNSNSKSISLTAAAYNYKIKLLVTGFSNGSFILYEMPDITLIHSLQLSNNSPITSIALNDSGDWIAIGSYGNQNGIECDDTSQSQLIVWEWQSESFILKQSGYSTTICQCIAYSPDATLLASGGSDGKIKIWDTFSGFCVATLSDEHRAPVTSIEFVPRKDGKVFISASLDGTLKAFDLNRYRNFKTFSLPFDSKQAQFISLAIDPLNGDFIAAGAHNLFEIFLWSIQTGRLLECLTGHEAPVSGLSFSPISNTLVSCSWDYTVRIWDLFEGSKCTREVIKLGSDALAIAFKPDGNEFAVSTINGSISFFNVHTAEQLGVSIEGKDDLGVSQYKNDVVKDSNKHFSALYYSIDGDYIIAGGKSKHVCVYHVHEKMLVKKFAISFNLSLDGQYDYISKRKLSEFGFNTSLIKQRDAIGLPGQFKNDLSDRSLNPVISVYSIRFSPTMRTFALASTEGILVYSLDKANIFDPFQLDVMITPMSVKKLIDSKQYCDALIQAIKLNDQQLIECVLESVPVSHICFVCETFPFSCVEKCLLSIAIALKSTKHIEFYLKWCESILYKNTNLLKHQMSIEKLMSTLHLLQQNISHKFQNLSKLCEHNKYLLRFVKILGQFQQFTTDEEMS